MRTFRILKARDEKGAVLVGVDLDHPRTVELQRSAHWLSKIPEHRHHVEPGLEVSTIDAHVRGLHDDDVVAASRLEDSRLMTALQLSNMIERAIAEVSGEVHGRSIPRPSPDGA